MARKVFNTSSTRSSASLQSQTPSNYSTDNYWLRELQRKVNFDWKYRPDRATIEYETPLGSNLWTVIEMVIQSVRDEKGEKIADDFRKLVFKDIKQVVPLGTKWRFAPEYDTTVADNLKDVWLTINYNTIDMTSSLLCSRCTNTLVSEYVDAQGITQTHIEPVILGRDSSSINELYRDVASTPGSIITATIQYNQYTKQYKLNQRFIIGQQVYKIIAINQSYANSTYDATDIGLFTFYLEITQVNPYDNFETRVAYPSQSTVESTSSDSSTYSIRILAPETIPTDLLSTPVNFSVYLYQDSTQLATPVSISCSLEGTPTTGTTYYNLSNVTNNSFTLSRARFYSGGDLIVRCFVGAADSPSGSEIFVQFNLSMRGLE